MLVYFCRMSLGVSVLASLRSRVTAVGHFVTFIICISHSKQKSPVLTLCLGFGLVSLFRLGLGFLFWPL